MRKILGAFALAFVLLATFAAPMMADPVTPDPNQGIFNLFIGTSVTHWLAISLAVMVFIAGLKNIPAIADIFVRWPQAAVIVNALVALLTQLAICTGVGGQHVEGFGFLNCTLGAIGLFVGAAGWHFVKKSLSPPPRDVVSNSASEAAIAAAPSKHS